MVLNIGTKLLRFMINRIPISIFFRFFAAYAKEKRLFTLGNSGD